MSSLVCLPNCFSNLFRVCLLVCSVCVVSVCVACAQNVGGATKYRWTLPSLVMIGRAEGLAGLYKGYIPKLVRLGPGGGIMIVMFDLVVEQMHKFRDNNTAKH